MKLTLKKTLKATMLITTAMLGLSSTALATGTDAFKQSISLQGLSFEEQLAKVRYFANKYANMTGEEQEIFLDEVNRTIAAKTNPDHRHQLSAAALGFETGGTQTSTLDDAVKLYEQGNYKEAARIFKDYAEQRNAGAQFNLGLMYHNGQGVTQDDRQAVKWWQKAAEQGNAGAQYNLGLMYKKGQGVAQDYRQAAKWYQKAAEQGDVDAQFNLGLMYYHGQGVAQDYRQAAKWWQKAAEQGDYKAQFNLGVMYDNGLGVKKNIKTSKKWVEKACNNGYQRACDELRSFK